MVIEYDNNIFEEGITMKKLICTLLSILFVIAVMAPGLCLATEEAFPESPDNPMRYTLTSRITASLSISGGTAHVAGNVSAKYASAHCSIKVQLQKKDSNGVWHGVKSWTNSDTLSASAGGDVSVSSGSYRTCVTATVTYNGNSEHPYAYSGTKTC